MKRQSIIGGISAGVLLLGFIGLTSAQPQTSNINTSKSVDSTTVKKEEVKVSKPVCDGTIITKNCTIDEINYTTYVYHAAVAEKSHTETVTTYREEITSYCTLCNDGIYSPSCATGRGACSHHGGVAQWNAPRYDRVAENTTKTVIDAPAQEAYYEKVIE